MGWKEKYRELNDRMARGFGKRYYNYYQRRRAKSKTKKKTTPQLSVGQRAGIIILSIGALCVGFAFLLYVFFYAPALAQRRVDAINIVRGYGADEWITIDKLVQDEVVSSWEMGYPKRAVWDAGHVEGDIYVVTLQFGIGNPPYEYEHVAQWAVNIKTENIIPGDNQARDYMEWAA